MDIYARKALSAIISSVWLPKEIVDSLTVSFNKLLMTRGFDLHSMNKLREGLKQNLKIYMSAEIKDMSTLP